MELRKLQENEQALYVRDLPLQKLFSILQPCLSSCWFSFGIQFPEVNMSVVQFTPNSPNEKVAMILTELWESPNPVQMAKILDFLQAQE